MNGVAGLLERERQLAELERHLARAAAGSGGVVAVTAPAGLGKTSVLSAVRERAGELGLKTMVARGGELERDFAFGILRQLFEPVTASLSPAELRDVLAGAASVTGPLLGLREARDRRLSSLFPLSTGSLFPLLHGFYWLAVNLAARGPFLAIVDDLQWADEQSLQWVMYLARRIEELPVGVVLASRQGEPGASEVLDQVLGEPAVGRVTLPALGEAAVAELMARAFPGPVDDAFARACFRATGGNPFFVNELARELVAGGVEPTAEAATAVPAVRPAKVERSVLARIGRLSGDARGLARAVAILGDDAELRHAAALAGLDRSTAVGAAEELVRADIFGVAALLAFVHPLVRTAVYEDISPALRAEQHGHAARLLRADSRPPERIASHLMHAHAVGDADAVVTLWAAAAEARERGAPQSAARYLERALREPSPRELRPALLGELGMAEAHTGAGSAIAHLRRALDMTTDPPAHAMRALDLANVLLGAGASAEGYGVLEQAIAGLGEDDREIRLALEAQLVTVGQIELELASRARRRLHQIGPLAGDTAGERLVLAALALERRLVGEGAEKVSEIAERALAGGRLLVEQPPDSPIYYHTVLALGSGARADELLARAAAEARRRGSLLGRAIAGSTRALLLRSRGDVRELEAEATGAVQASREVGWRLGLALSLAAHVNASVAQGRGDDAETALQEAGMADELPARLYCNFLLYERAALRASQLRPAEALADLEELGRREASAGHALHAVRWRAAAAAQLLTLGRGERARELAEEAVERARSEDAATLGIALRALGLADNGRRIGLLGDAVSALGDAGASVELATALIDLGAALRRAGRRAEAREPLRTGFQLAHDLGAVAAAERAHQELTASGSRPRGVRNSGFDTLTASERRVARLAAQGLSNPEIAQTLFVTVKTVETHLHRTYQKLGLDSRRQLAGALKA